MKNKIVVIAECYKYRSHFVIDAMIDIFYQMRDEGYLLNMSWIAWISPTQKRKNIVLSMNYRPIVLTNNFFIFFEGAMREQILELWEENNVKVVSID